MKFNTVTKKIALIVSAIGIIVLLIVNTLFSSIFYYIMRSHLMNQISSIVTTNALRQSYIWSNNTVLRDLQSRQEIHQLISNYYNNSSESNEAKEEIVTYLPVIETGIVSDQSDNTIDHGYIVYTCYTALFTSEGDIFFDEGSENAARILQESDWYQNFDYDIDYFEHLPIIEDKSDPDNSIFCMVSGFQVDGIACFGVNIVRAQDILVHFEEFNDFNIDDYLLYCNGNIIYSSLETNSSIDLEKYPDYMFDGGQYKTQTWEDGDDTNFMVLCTYKTEDYRVVVNVSKDNMLLPYNDVFLFFRLLIGGIIVILLIIFCIILRGYLNRLVKLDKKMNRVRNGDYNVSVHDNSKDEIGNLANTFNMMLDRIKTDMENVEKMQYSLMVSAIDPHYIYNTMNTITALAEMGRNDDVVTVNKALIATIKDRLKMKNYKTFDTVKAEMEAIEQYMIIQNFHCHQEVLFDFKVAKYDLMMLIPKNIIQPLVENSIKHGILCNEDINGDPVQGIINILVKRLEGKIYIEIEDNGIGIDESTLNQYFNFKNVKKTVMNNDMEHIGVYNVQMRLNYLYKENFQFLVDSRVGFSTKITIILPDDNK